MFKTISLGALALALAACGQQADTHAGDAVKEAATEVAAVAEEAVDTVEAAVEEVVDSLGDRVSGGSFEGRSQHITTGEVTIYQAGEKFVVVLEENFSLDGAPDPKLGFGNPEFVTETLFSPLREISGRQVYELPEGLNPADFETIYVWCEQFSVPLGVASLG